MAKILFLLSSLFLPCVVSSLYAATPLSGTVIDDRTEDALAGVAVFLKEDPRVTAITGPDGSFTIYLKEGQCTLVFSCLGYQNLEIDAWNSSWDRVARMTPDNFRLDEVVVTGQAASIQKRRISTNISSITSDEIDRLQQGRIDRMLQSSLPNVMINLTSGQPGTTSMIRSRGISSAYSNSTPVIYVDGIRVDNTNTSSALANMTEGVGLGQTASSGSISDIPMENIERIEFVPGGAATTLYGSDAANGVIQIFTKKGGSGRLSAFFETELGTDQATSQYYYFKRTKELLHQSGFSQKYRVGFDGGNDRFGYSFAASMNSSTGTLICDGNADRKYDLRFGSRARLGDMLEYSNSFGMVAEDFSRTRNGNQGYYTGLWFTEGAASANFKYRAQDGTMTAFNPDIDAQDDYGYEKMKEFVTKAESLQNNKESVRRFQTSHSISFTPLANLTFKGTIGVDYRTNSNKNIETNEYLIHTQVKPEGTSDAGSIMNFTRNYLGLTMEANGQYRAKAGDVASFITTGGFQFFSTYDHQAIFNGFNVRDGALVITGAGTVVADEWLSYLYNYGFYLQENVGIFDRLYIDLGLRADYNTAFGDNVGWQFYPKAGVSYILSDEKFFEPVRSSGMVTSLRLFANYGIAGNYPPAFEYQKTIGVNSYLGQQAANFGKYGNPDLGPEKKHSYEAGINAVLFKNVLNLAFAYYYALTKDALFNVPTLPSSGQESTYLANVGLIENKGIELSAGVQIVDTRDWNVRLNASFNTNRNIVLSTGGTVPFAIGGFSSRTIQTVVQERKPVGFLRGSKAVLNEDGSVKEVLELQDLGTTIPVYFGNMSLSVSYKGVQLFMSGDYQAGSYVHSFDRQFRFAKGIKDPAVPEKALEGTTQGEQWLNFTNFFVEKADFFKIRNIGISYTFRFDRFIRGLSLGFNVYNPFSFTASSVDPEAVLSGARYQGAVATGGLNYSSYSLPIQYIGTLKIIF